MGLAFPFEFRELITGIGFGCGSTESSSPDSSWFLLSIGPVRLPVPVPVVPVVLWPLTPARYRKRRWGRCYCVLLRSMHEALRIGH